MRLKALKHAEICGRLNRLYQKKNHDYGDAFAKAFKKSGLNQTVMRLTDKLSRLETLASAEAAVSDESVEDTLMDLANYSIMSLIELQMKEDNENG